MAELMDREMNSTEKVIYEVPLNKNNLSQVNVEATDPYYRDYHCYTRLEKTEINPLLPYGAGLSYTTFKITSYQVSRKDDLINVNVKVRNTGTIDGDEVLQLCISFENSSVERAIRQLRSFLKASVKAGEEKSITITIPVEKLKWFNPVNQEWKLEHMEYPVYVGTSSDCTDLCKTVLSL